MYLLHEPRSHDLTSPLQDPSFPSVISELPVSVPQVPASYSTNSREHISNHNGLIAYEEHARLAVFTPMAVTPSATRY
jgi:hypothetical protein